MRSRSILIACGLALVAVGGCQTSKSSTPTAPTVAGPIPGVNITAPVMLEPAQGFKFKENEQPIRLVIQNATTNGVRALSYTFEVASDADFTNKVFSRSGIAPGDGNKTTVQLDRLEIGRSYFWRAWAADGANTGSISTANFEIFPKPAVNPPVAVSPVNNEQVSSTTPNLVVHNAKFVGPVSGLVYEFQVATDQAFSRLVTAGVFNEGNGDTTFRSNPLPNGATLFWHARASDGQTSSDWSITQAFRTPAAPAPSPSPGPTPTPGAACVSSSAPQIISCERNKFGHMNDSQLLQFLTNASRSLNANGIAGGPFGLLRKSGGASCGGYSCDIICSGNGSGQRQWDVLGDAEGAQTPAWSGPNTVPNIRVDVCEIK